jgi:hypothetical protein
MVPKMFSKGGLGGSKNVLKIKNKKLHLKVKVTSMNSKNI